MSPLETRQISRSRLVDRVAAFAITAGGSLVLLAVALLVAFLFAQCLPLLTSGSARGERAAAGDGAALVVLEDEYRESVTVLRRDGALLTMPRGGAPERRELSGAVPPLRQAVVSAAGDLLAVVDAAGVGVWSVRTEVQWSAAGRTVTTAVAEAARVPSAEGTILAVAGSVEEPRVLLRTADGAAVLAGDGGTAWTFRLGQPAAVGALSQDGREVWLATGSGLATFALDEERGGELAPVATAPLAAAPTAMITALGDVTCLLGDSSGTVTAWQVAPGPVAGSRILDRAGSFDGPGPVRALVRSGRNKCFVVERGGRLEVAHLTTRRVLLELPGAPSDLVNLAAARRFDGLAALDAAGGIHRWALDVPHPETSLGTLFLPVRYEGYTRPDLVWQSTGGSESFEPKLSLVPLLVGTLKGALYALLFSGPCAVAAALYVSQLAPRRLRSVVKPVIELMAALPSVVVGFLAALLIAPLLQRHLVGALLLVAAVPAVICLAAVAVQGLPGPWRRSLSPARELVLLTALLATVTVLCFWAEGALERVLFSGDLKGWLLATAGVTYDQRNALVVGLALGFAVIPIIFTLAEDAFSNVPQSLISASLALGATRWQAARTVAVPAASPGLFAALMTGLGRAVGETMIVLMATGNTPVLSMSPWNGMRTMSATLAVELPEAPFGGTLYRVLILTALLLFVLTFLTNTAAVVVASRLRKRFGRLAA